MLPRESQESALLQRIGTLEHELSLLSVQFAGMHLRREAARLASDAELRERWEQGMQAVEAELSRVQAELIAAEKRYHSLE